MANNAQPNLQSNPSQPGIMLHLFPSVLKDPLLHGLNSNHGTGQVLLRPLPAGLGGGIKHSDMENIRLIAMFLSNEVGGIDIHAHILPDIFALRIGPVQDPAIVLQCQRGIRVGTWKYRQSPGLLQSHLYPRRYADLRDQKKKTRKPRNSFIIYRSAKHSQVAAEHPEMKNGELSKFIGALWTDEVPEVKSHFADLALTEREQHAIENPGWKCKPRRSSEIKRRGKRGGGPSWPGVNHHLARIGEEVDGVYGDARVMHEGTFFDGNNANNTATPASVPNFDHQPGRYLMRN